jgi:hypothetical protein
MKRIVFAATMALLVFVTLNFVYWNLDDATFGYEVVFKFKIPHLLDLRSVPISLGFVLLISFCLGMVAIAVLEALPSLFKTLEIRAKNRRIRHLEKELALAREIAMEKGATELGEGDDSEE